MKLTILDTHTGIRYELNQPLLETDDYWWSEGNGSCDCNRALYCGFQNDLDTCIGCHRFLIVAAPESKLTLTELNSSYPEQLVAKHCS